MTLNEFLDEFKIIAKNYKWELHNNRLVTEDYRCPLQVYGIYKSHCAFYNVGLSTEDLGKIISSADGYQCEYFDESLRNHLLEICLTKTESMI